MAVEELNPILQELTRNPIAFMGGFAAGLLRLNLSEDPLKTWLGQQGQTIATDSTGTSSSNSTRGPQSITID